MISASRAIKLLFLLIFLSHYSLSIMAQSVKIRTESVKNLASNFYLKNLQGCMVSLGGYLVVTRCRNGIVFFTDVNQWLDPDRKRFRFYLSTKTRGKIESIEYFGVN